MSSLRQQPSPPTPSPTIHLPRSTSAFGGNREHYDRWKDLLLRSTHDTDQNNATSCGTVSESGIRYNHFQFLRQILTNGVEIRRPFGGGWSENGAFFAAMSRADHEFSLPRTRKRKKPPMAPPRRAPNEKVERWISALRENNAKYGAEPPEDDDDAGERPEEHDINDALLDDVNSRDV